MVTALTSLINTLCQPSILFFISCGALYFVLFPGRHWFAKKSTIVLLEVALAIFLGLSMLHPTFRATVMKPDNVPIVIMLFLILFFTWLAIHKAVINDNLLAAGKEVETRAEAKQVVFTWPDLVFSEFICTIVVW